MTISVLMSVYKAEKPKYLDRALQSVWTDQTLKPNKIVLVEDGELTQELYQVIDKWKSELKDFLLVLQNDTNLGLTKSLNKGIKYIDTDLIARMDSDDISAPERFELQHNFLEKNKNISVVGGDIEEFCNDNSTAIRTHPYTNEDIVKTIYKANPLAHSTVMMKTEIFKSGLQYNEKYRNNQDLELWFNVLASGTMIANIDSVLVKFRLSDNVFKRRSKKSALMEFKIYMQGIRKLYGLINVYYIYPIIRLVFRLMPASFVKIVYNSKLRNSLVK